MFSRVFYIPKQRIFSTVIIAMLVLTGSLIFQALTAQWVMGGIVTTLCILTGIWAACSLIIQRATEKQMPGVSALKVLSFIVIMVMAFTLTSQLVLAGENHEVGQGTQT